MSFLGRGIGLVLVWLAVIGIGPSIAGARIITLTEVLEHYPEEITHITTCGRWRSGDGSGIYRVVLVEFLFGGSRLWIQWMSDRDQDGRMQVVETFSPSTINNDHAEYAIEALKCGESEKGVEVAFRAESGHSGEVSDVRILVKGEPGDCEVLGLAR